MRLLRKAAASFDWVINFLAYFACVLLVFVMLSVAIEILVRFFVGRSQLWVVEICEYILLFIPFLGAAWLLRREGHVKMDLVLDRLKPKTQTLLNIITSIIGAIVCLVVTWYGAEATWQNFQKEVVFLKVMAFPKAPIMAVIPIGCLLLFIQFLRRTYGYLGSWRALRDQGKKVVDQT